MTFRSYASLNARGHPAQPSTETGAIDFHNDSYRVELQDVGSASGLERIVVPGALYDKPTNAPFEVAWEGVRIKKQPLLNLGSSGLSDPLGLLNVLGKSRGAQRIGNERVDGVMTTHYRLDATLVDFLPAHSTRAELRLARGVGALIDVWLDKASRVIRARRLFVVRGFPPARLAITTDFADYGSHEVVARPTGVKLPSLELSAQPVIDPLNGRILGLLRSGSLHPTTPAVLPQHP
jgi:hypothetical protein